MLNLHCNLLTCISRGKIKPKTILRCTEMSPIKSSSIDGWYLDIPTIGPALIIMQRLHKRLPFHFWRKERCLRGRWGKFSSFWVFWPHRSRSVQRRSVEGRGGARGEEARASPLFKRRKSKKKKNWKTQKRIVTVSWSSRGPRLWIFSSTLRLWVYGSKCLLNCVW